MLQTFKGTQILGNDPHLPLHLPPPSPTSLSLLACSRLSDSGGERKIGASEKLKPVGIGDGGAGAGEREKQQ